MPYETRAMPAHDASSNANLADVLRSIVEEKPPSAQRNAVYDELRKHEKTIKAAIQNGWTATQLASRMRDRGVKASEERLRTEIRKIAGLPARPRSKSSRSD